MTLTNCKGLATAIIRNYQQIARQDSSPLWLEASNQRSHDIYHALGFQDAGAPLVLGKGTVSAEGERQKGGTGVLLWPMVWWPQNPERAFTQPD